ncbi:CBF1-interacting co-repressor CIR N-terminal domain-containing protein [Plasmodiophora brassicae]|uniref:CBF1-interacting co-repressor CIR N-terminal domain-containing protein n=1 Tax=Plasmodiophora brassicae TaxID=37360 RepID=A0A0G4IIB5_PLABS|nr:hypothetical protein PBRA_003633 [Plasmodiophora brassicae]SPQ94157.1 unnamed protein product [Plasmodiophora brassicae]
MGKGGLSFLNKKSWHTATIANAEKVWLAEQKDAAEKSKLAQLRKEIEEERQVEELRKLQLQRGGTKHVERLDWMYRSADVEAQQRDKEREEFLLGKTIPSSELQEPTPDVSAPPPTLDADRWIGKYERRDLDAETRIREDPMLAILQQEHQQRLRILRNPLEMRRIRDDVDRSKKLKKALKKVEKQERKEKRRAEKAARDADANANADRKHKDDDGGDDDPYGLIVSRTEQYSRRSRSPRHRRRSRSRSPRRLHRPQSHSPRRHRHRHHSASRSRSPERDEEKDDRHRYRDDSRNGSRRRDRLAPRRQRDVASSKNSALTQEERAARLAAMQADADAHHAARSAAADAADVIARQEQADLHVRGADAPQSATFIQSARKQAYLDSNDTVEDRLNQRRHYRQKGNMEEHSFL